MRGRYLQRLALYGRRRYYRVFLVAGLLLLLSIGLALQLRVDSDVLNLLPQDEPIVSTFRSTLEDFGGVDLLLVLVDVPEGVAIDPYEMFVERLAGELESLPGLEYVDYRIGNIEELISSYFPKSFLFLDEAGRAAVEERLSEEGIRTRAAEVRRLLATPQSVLLKSLFRVDPLGLSDIFIGGLASTRGALRVDLTSGFFLSADHRLLLLMAKPVRPAQEIDFTTGLIASVDARVEALREEWPEMVGGDDPPPSPVVSLGGNYITAIEDAGTIRRDVIVNALTSMIGVLVLFLFAFRRLGLLLYAFVPLLTGLVMTFGFTGLTIGSLNAASGAFAALLVGLGIDFVIVSYGRYVEERRRGKRLAGALRAMAGSCGRAVLIGGITSAATFYAFTGTVFVGLRQMGLLTGTGILFCMLAVIFLLPAMLAWSEDHHKRRSSYPRLYLHGFGSSRMIRTCMRRPRTVLAVGGLVTVVLAGMATRLKFEDSIREMRPQGNRAAEIESRMAEHFGSGFDFMMLVLREQTLEAVLELTAVAAERADSIAGTEELVRSDSIASILPPSRRQQEVLAWLESHRADLMDVERVRSTFLEAAQAEGLRGSAFESGLDLFATAAAVREPISLRDLALDDSSRHLLERYVREGEDGWTSIVYLYPPATIWKREPPPGARRLADELGPQVELSGVNVVSEFLRTTVKRDAIIAGIVGFVLVAILLWIDFRNLRDAILSLVPLCIGLVWMLGGMVLMGLPMNFFNIFVSTMIIGIGVDYGIHMMHRYRESHEQPRLVLEGGMVETGKAIVLAALSTTIGFGSLSLSSYPGLRTIGYVAILGALSTAFVAVTLLPAYLSLRIDRLERRRAAAAD
jgi:predicted RND superfamily exporter protein